MKTKRHNACASLATVSFLAGSVALLPAGEVGPMGTFAPPAPVSDCASCSAPGWYANLSLVYMQFYGDGAESSPTVDGDWDFGGRASIGFEQPDGLFFELNVFSFEGDFDESDDDIDGEIESFYIEGLFGDNLICGGTCLDYGVGIRYLSSEKSEIRNEDDSNFRKFEGIGPVVRLDGLRPLNDQVSLYGGISLALLVGEEEQPDDPDDKSAFMAEVEAGVQIALNIGQVQDAHLRLGIEGQNWSVDEDDNTLFGGVIGVGFNF